MDPLEQWPVASFPAEPAVEPYPVELVVARSNRPSRLTSAIRVVMVLPHLAFSLVMELVAVIVVVGAWVCGSLSGRVPDELRAVLLWILRYRAWVDCYAVLLTDQFPPFTGADDRSAPIRVVARPAERQPRWSVFLRGFLVLPALFVSLCLLLVLLMVAIATWAAVLLGGRLPPTAAELLEMGSGFILRTRGYAALLTARYPWFEHDAPDER